MLWYNLICNLQHSLLTSLNPKSCFTVPVPWLSRVPSLIIKYLCAQCLQIQNNLCSFYLKKNLFAIKYLITCASTNAIYCTWWLPRVGKNCAWSLKCISETTKADVAGLSASRCDAANLFCSVFLFSNIKEMMIQINLCSYFFFYLFLTECWGFETWNYYWNCKSWESELFVKCLKCLPYRL